MRAQHDKVLGVIRPKKKRDLNFNQKVDADAHIDGAPIFHLLICRGELKNQSILK